MALITVIKVALAAGTIYATKQLGVWDSPEVTSVIYNDAKSHIKPYGLQLKEKYCCRECETCQREPPKPWRESLVDAWNDTIKKTFDILVQVPTYCRRFTEDVQETINIFVNKNKTACRSKFSRYLVQNNSIVKIIEGNIMGLKFLTRVGMLASLQDRGITEKPELSVSITKFSDENLQSLTTPFGICNFSAQNCYNEAIERGLYFSNRMRDWSTEFKKQTSDIFNIKPQSNLAKKRYQDQQCNEYSILYPKIQFEKSPLDYFDEHECSTSTSKSVQPVKPPKIKDDITCRKRRQSD